MIRVLVIDDLELNRNLIADFLTGVGMEVIAVPDGTSALNELQREQTDVIIMDVQMPGMDGLEVTRTIRRLADPRIALIPILGLTAMGTSKDRDKCLAAGMTDFRLKPFPLRQLAQQLQMMVNSAGPAV